MRKTCLILLLALLLLGSTAVAETNLLTNGGFEEVENGRPVGWKEEMWLYDVGVTYMELREDGMDGGLSAMIENVGSNDARFIQTVQVEPDAVYHFSGWVKAENCNPEFAGASLSVIGTYASFPEVHDTAGEWVFLECWVQPADGQKELVIGPRLGDYSADNTGKAYFDNLAFVKEQGTPLGVDIIPLRDYASVQSQPVDQESASSGNMGMLGAIVAFVLLCVLLWFLRMRGVPYPKAAIWVLLALAAVLRIFLMATQPGYETDMGCFYAWSYRMAEVGPNEFYAPDYFCDYPPGYMYLLWFTGGLMNLFGIQSLSPAGRVIVKLVPMLADLGAVYMIWRLARKRMGETPAVLLAALYAFSPAILVDGAIWGQVDSVLALGLLATVALAMSDNWKAALPVFTVTVLMKPQALMAAPIGLVALVMDFLPWDKESRRLARDAGIGLGISAGVAALMLLPFLWGKEAPISWIIDKYATTLGSYAYATLNTTNLFYLFGANWVPLDAMLGPFNYGTWGTILMVVVVIGLMALYAWRRDKNLLPFFCAMIYMGLYLLGVKMHERYLFPAFLLLVYAYIRKPDWRLLAMFGGFSVTFFINCAWVLRDTHLPTGFDLGGSIMAVINLALFGLGIWLAVDHKTRPLPTMPERETVKVDRLPALYGPSKPMARMQRKDWIAMLGLTLVYTAVAYIGLGSTLAPQTLWTSTGAQEEVIFDLGADAEYNILYYGGINGRDHVFDLDFSEDGQTWGTNTPLKMAAGDCFRWQFATEAYFDSAGVPSGWSSEPLVRTSRYVRLTAENPGLTLMELTFRDLDGNVLPVKDIVSIGARAESAGDPSALVDEGSTAPEAPSYYNGTYFDEIYHARTGYEHANGLSTYEWTHPPLGKVLIMLGIKLFGMTPFGWRFMGTLMGVLMVPAMYMLGKLLFKRTRFAFLAAFVMAFDMMHLTQTRIATIDSYAVLFIILMYTCMFRYMQMSFFRDGWRTLIPLGLSGVFMGLGCASKWICMYAGVGLAVLFAWSMVQRFLEWRAGVNAGGEHAEMVQNYPKYLIGTLGFCAVFFIAIPFAIYYFSYIPHFAWEGGLTWERFWNTQTGIFDYHAKLVDNHAFKSPWYEWPLMLKPMYYFNGKPFVAEGNASTIMCMGNPAVWWVGFGAFLYVFWCWLKPHLYGERVKDRRPAMLLLAFAAQFLPWVLVPRSMFIYHYFGSLPFVMLCIVYAFEQFYRRNECAARVTQIAYMAVVLVLFVGFYPIATGVQVSEQWIKSMNWLGFLKLPGWQFKGWIYY